MNREQTPQRIPQQQETNTKLEEKLKASFREACTGLAKFNKETKQLQNEAYLQGQIDALNELMNFCFQQTGGNIQKMPTETFLKFIQDKMNEIEQTQPRANPMNQIQQQNTDQLNSSLPTPIKEVYNDYQNDTQTSHNFGSNMMQMTGLGSIQYENQQQQQQPQFQLGGGFQQQQQNQQQSLQGGIFGQNNNNNSNYGSGGNNSGSGGTGIFQQQFGGGNNGNNIFQQNQ